MGQSVAGNITTLYPHGINSELAQWRAHVAIPCRQIFMFPTKKAVELIAKNGYPLTGAYQINISYPTAQGHLIPVRDFGPSLQRTAIPLDIALPTELQLDQYDTSQKGRLAADVVIRMLQRGIISMSTMWECENPTYQQDRSGIDLIICSKILLQIKCDVKICKTGNLYIQTAEVNPLKKY